MKRKLLIVICIIAVLFLSACDAEEPAPEVIPEDLPELKYSVSSNIYTDEFREGNARIAQYIFNLPRLSPSDSRGDDTAAAFNSIIDTISDNLITGFENETLAAAREEYNGKKEAGEEWGEGYYSQEVKYTYILTKNYLGIALDYYTSVRKAYPQTGFSVVLFDLVNNREFTYRDLSDDPDGIGEAISRELLIQMKDQGLAEYYYDGYEKDVKSLEKAEMYFAEDGITVIFPEYSLAPHAAGLQMFLVDYSVINEYLNDFGVSVLYEFTGVVG